MVVGTFTAIVCMLRSGSTDCTSGPWWEGIFRTGSMALMGPRRVSQGSAARRIMTAKASSKPKATWSGYSVLMRPVVLQDGTRR